VRGLRRTPGQFPLYEARIQYQAGGGRLEDLVIDEVALAVSAFPQDEYVDEE
jgi:hypothetical protein